MPFLTQTVSSLVFFIIDVAQENITLCPSLTVTEVLLRSITGDGSGLQVRLEFYKLPVM